MLATLFKPNRRAESHGVVAIATPNGLSVETDHRTSTMLVVEVWHAGKLLMKDGFNSTSGWRENRLGGRRPQECGIRVLDLNNVCIISMNAEPDPFPFMTLQGEQHHITENDVAVPPALTITDEVGSVWTLGLETAPKAKSPDGEFAFAVLRNGLDTGEIASRIERRGGKIKIFTAEGWKTFTGRSFF